MATSGAVVRTSATAAATVAFALGAVRATSAYIHGGLDFDVYRAAAVSVVADTVYQPTAGGGLPFTYPPTAALLLHPLALVPRNVGLSLWLLLSVVALGWSIYLVVRSAAPAASWAGPVAVAFSVAALAVWPVQETLALGQVNLLLMAAVVTATLGPPGPWSGPLLGVATAVKLTPALFLLWWWDAGRRRSAGAAAATVVGVAVVAAAALPWSTRSYLGGWLTTVAGGLEPLRPANQSLFGVAGRTGWPGPVAAAVAVAVGIVAVRVATLVDRSGRRAVAVGLVGVWTGLLSPLGWDHQFVWWVPLGVALVCGSARGQRVVGVVVLAVAAIPVSDAATLAERLSADGGIGALGAAALSGCYAITAVAVTAFLAATTRSRAGLAALRPPPLPPVACAQRSPWAATPAGSHAARRGGHGEVPQHV